MNSRPIACNCDGPVQHIDVSSSYKIGDKGIYYLPVDSTPNQNIIIPLSELNFNVQKPSKQNLSLQLYGKYADLSMLKNNNNRNKKHVQSDEDVQTTSRKPLYIDIQFSKTETLATFSSEANADTIQQGNNKYLEECLDIHTVLHSRRNQTIPKLRENWGAEKFDKYNILSDFDLLKESNAKCAHLNDIVKQSINEIKQSLTTKLDGTKLHAQNRVNRHSYRNVSSILPDKTVHIKSTSTRNYININNSSTSKPVVTNDEYISSNEQKHNISKIIHNARPFVDWFSGVEADSTKTITGNLDKVTMVSVSTRSVVDATTKKSQLITNKTKSIHKEINNGIVNPIHKTSTNELTSMATDIPINPNYESTPLNDSENTDHDDNDFRSETLQLKVSTEIVNNTAIQKTTGTNCTTPNKCLASTKKGFPEIEFRNIVDAVSTDNLFVVDVSATTPSMIPANTAANSAENIIGISVDTTTYVYEPTSEANVNVNRDNSTSKTSEPELVKNASITGSIYFNYRNQNVPARFIQDPAGHVSISIDVITLCDKLNFANNGSLLIGVMCKCV